MIRRPPRSTLSSSSAASDVYKRQADYVSAELPGVRVLAVPVGGYIFAHPNYVGPDAQSEPETARLSDFQRDALLFQPHLKSACVQALGVDSWQCFIPTTAYTYVSTQMVVIEAQTDSTVLFGFSDAPFKNEPSVQQYVTEFRLNATKVAQNVADSNQNAIFSPCCFMHTGFERHRPTILGTDFYDLITHAAFNTTKQPSYVDSCQGFNCSTDCPGHESSR
eukprot:TRINITY_DN13606_c0_g1_i5.p1 TRINITY_DN13606_c0_g1~~TRINITY_DN13606_c0_g1_i5.p1  ORF type:complete len:221 (+),score=25.57 TRINITY_DN13606_c0_g1_i5:92-754(+)